IDMNIAWGHGITTQMMLQILELCPRLEKYIASTIFAIDIAQSQPWACLRSLRRLEVGIDMSLPEMASMTFDELSQRLCSRLAMVTQLEVLCTGRVFLASRPTLGTQFHLGNGLDRLSALKRLQKVTFG